MRAIITNTRTHETRLGEIEKPSPRDGEVLVRTLYTGVCRTDIEIVEGMYGEAPDDSGDLVLFHEAVGVVEESRAPGLEPGDLVVPTVRRGCGKCKNCEKGRADYCLTGEYKERGIKGLHGFGSDFFVEKKENLVVVNGIDPLVAVCLEPLSIISKAFERVLLEEGFAREFGRQGPILVTGLGPIGQCAIRYLHHRGLVVHAWDVLPRESPKIQGAMPYLEKYERFDENPRERYSLVIECSGSTPVIERILSGDTLYPNGILVVLGIPGERYEADLSLISKNTCLGNITIVGCVNSSKCHFVEARNMVLEGLALGEIVTRVHPLEEYRKPLFEKSPDEIKQVIEWSRP